MADDHNYTVDRPIDTGADQTGETPLRVDKAVVKEALSELLAEVPAFRELMSLPGPSADGSAHARRDPENAAPTGSSPRPGKRNLNISNCRPITLS